MLRSSGCSTLCRQQSSVGVGLVAWRHPITVAPLGDSGGLLPAQAGGGGKPLRGCRSNDARALPCARGERGGS